MVRHGSGDAFRCCCSEAQNCCHPKLFSDDLGKPEIGGSEVVGPVGYTVSLINADKSNGGKVGKESSKSTSSTCNCLRRDQEKVQPA